MRWLFQPLLLLLANSADSDLARQVQYLKAENEILRRHLGKRPFLAEKEKRLLVKLGLAVGKGIKDLLSVVAYPTFRRWVGLYDPANAGTKPAAGPRGKGGRPRTPDETRELVLRLAKENEGWGYTRILGELKKLGTTKVCRSTVVNILRENEIDPKEDPTKGGWAEFLKAHAKSLWQCDFFSKHVVTAADVRQCFVLAFIHVQTRRVFKPDAAWVRTQAEGFLAHAKAQGLEAGVLLRDRDCKYTKTFDGALEAGGATVKPVGYRSPNQNAYVERFVQAIERECLDKFIVFEQEHLDLICRQYVEHYHTERPHQAMGNTTLLAPAVPVPTTGELVCRERLGGVLRHYTRAAA